MIGRIWKNTCLPTILNGEDGAGRCLVVLLELNQVPELTLV
jgi:hypothetical protein